jgi:chitodextrinase
MNDFLDQGQTVLGGVAEGMSAVNRLCGVFGGVCNEVVPSGNFDLKTGQYEAAQASGTAARAEQALESGDVQGVAREADRALDQVDRILGR